MIIRDRSFPHPVLASFRDDVTPNAFALSVSHSHDADNYFIEVSFVYSNDSLQSHINENHATHTVHVECKRNFFREMFSFQQSHASIVLKASELVGRVEVSGFVTARVPIGSYRIAGAHADYGDSTFNIQAGDILAVAPTQYFDAYVDYDPLRRISSILTILRSEDTREGPMTLETSGDRIVATLAQADFDRYTGLKADPSLGPLLANQVVVPALLEAVHEIKATDEGELELEMAKRWFRSVYRKLEESGINIRSPESSALATVQALLRLPLRRSLEGLIQLTPMDEEQ